MNPASTQASAVATAAEDTESSSSSHHSEDLEQNTSMSMPQQEGRNEEEEEEEEEDEDEDVELDKEDDDEQHEGHNIIEVLKNQSTEQHQQVVAVHHPHVMPVLPLMSAKPATVQGSMTYGAHPIQHYHLHAAQYPYPYQQHQHHPHPYQYFHQHYVAAAPSTATATAHPHPHPAPRPISALPPHPHPAPPPMSALPPHPLQVAAAAAAHHHHHHPPPPPPPPSPPQYHVYPPPMAAHKDLIDNRHLFFTTLYKFHLSLGTKLTVPKIGGKDLDLHSLYKEVTDRGGLERVITERKWKEITVVLNLPRTTTSASFVLRKYYINLLHHYEQVHYFRVQGLPVPPPVPSPNLPVPITQSAHSDFKYPAAALESLDHKETRKRKLDSAQALGVDPASSIGSKVTGCIDAKLDYAYLVTVMVGTRKMRGVLYHVPPASGSWPQGASVSSLINMLEPQAQAQAQPQSQTQTQTAAAASDNSRSAMVLDPRTRIGMGTRQRRRHMSRKDPNAPRQNRTGYNFFFAEQRAKLKSVQPDKDRAISKMIGDLWNRLSEDEKSPYQERGLEDRERYRREMREYKERLRMGGCVGLGLHSSSSIRTSATAKKLDSFSNFGAAQESSRPTPVQERKEQLQLQSRSDVPTMKRPCNSSQHCHSEFGKACDSKDSQDNPTSNDMTFVEGSQT